MVYSGETISAYKGATKKEEFEECWERATEAVVEAGVPWAYILGNHEEGGNLTPKQIIRLDQEKPLSLRKGAEGIPDTCNLCCRFLRAGMDMS